MTRKNIMPTLSAQLEYCLQLPPKEVLQAKLHKAIEEAKLRLEVRND